MTHSPTYFPPIPVPNKEQGALRTFRHHVAVKIGEAGSPGLALSMPSRPLASESHSPYFWNELGR